VSEYLEEEEQLARLKTWWDENGRTLLVGVVVMLSGIVGFNWYVDFDENQRHEATRAYEAYSQAGVSGDTEVKEAAFINLQTDFSGRAVHIFALFEKAKVALETGDPQQALELLEQAVATAEDKLIVDLARIRLARLQQELDLKDQALATLSSVQGEGYRALVLEAKGDIHSAAGEVELAHQSYQAAVESLLASDSRPFLNMKLENTAPFKGEYVAMTDALTEALKAAQSTLEQADEDKPTTDADVVDESEQTEGTVSDGDD